MVADEAVSDHDSDCLIWGQTIPLVAEVVKTFGPKLQLPKFLTTSATIKQDRYFANDP